MFRCTSSSSGSPISPASIACRAAIIIGENRSWKLTAAFSPLSRQSCADRARLGQIGPHRFLDQHRRAIGQVGQDRGDRLRRHRDVIDRPRFPSPCAASATLANTCGMPKSRAKRLAPGGVQIGDARHRQPRLGIGRQMGVAHDAARADDDDGLGIAWARASPGQSFESWLGPPAFRPAGYVRNTSPSCRAGSCVSQISTTWPWLGRLASSALRPMVTVVRIVSPAKTGLGKRSRS